MKAKEVFPFIDKLFARGVLPKGRNMWAVAYNIEEYTEACEIAEKEGLDIQTFQEWLLEYARRCKPEEALMLPVIVRWGENERPQRRLVHVPMYSMKDFDSLPSAAEAALMLEVDADAGQEVYMRDMRAPDVPDVWARIVVEGIEKEVQFNPLKMWRGEVKLSAEWYNLKDVQVLEWHVMGQDAEVPPPTDCVTRLHAERVHAGGNKHEEEAAKMTPRKAFCYCMGMLAVVIAAVLLLIKGCVWLTTEKPEPPRAGDSVFIMKEKGVTGWQDIGWLRTYDRERNEGNTKAARKTMREAREQKKAKLVPYSTSGRVIKVAKKPHDTPDGEVYCVQVEFEEYGLLWVRSSDVIVTEKATTASRPGIGDKLPARRAVAAFSSKEDLRRMITLTTRSNETASAFLTKRASRGQAFILEAGEEVAIIDMDGWLEPYYLVQRMSDNRTGWVLCVAFE